MTQFTCKGVKQINNRISLNMTFTFTIRISRRFSSAGEFPEILIANCRSRFYCTLFFSRAEDFESWWEGRKGPSKSGEKCSRRKVHMYVTVLKYHSCVVAVLKYHTVITVLKYQCHNSSIIPQCHNSSKIPQCYNISKIPHCHDSSKIQHCHDSSKIK